jgi:Leucine-rich repeat (LRR) protein
VSKSSLVLFKYLQKLYLNSNQIDGIEADSFTNLDHLEVLRMGHNKIEALDEFLFQNLIRLKYLNLSSNSLKRVQANLFSKLYNLIELDLSNNNLVLLEPYSMLSLDKLENLYLNENKYLFIALHGLFGLKSIKNIYISFEALFNETNKLNFVKSINLSVSAVIMDKIYYKSINIIATFSQIDAINLKECGTILYFLKFNYLLNLKTDFHVVEFFRKCDKVFFK